MFPSPRCILNKRGNSANILARARTIHKLKLQQLQIRSKFALGPREQRPAPSGIRRSSFVRSAKTDSYNPRGFLSLLDGLRPVRVTSEPMPNLAATRAKSGRRLRPSVPILRDTTFIYEERGGRASDGGGSKVARRGIETYLLAQLAPVQHPPLSSRRNFGRPCLSRRANFRARYAFLKSVLVAVNLIPGCFDATIAQQAGRKRDVLPSTCVKNAFREGARTQADPHPRGFRWIPYGAKLTPDDTLPPTDKSV